jgi:hypothetical protein
LSSRAVIAALALVAATALAAAVVGLIAGLNSDLTTGVHERPWTYWLIALAYLGLALVFWPIMLSWFIPMDLPDWYRQYLARVGRQGSFERVREGRTVLQLAGSDVRLGRWLAVRTIWNGLFYVALTVPLPFMFGGAAFHPGRLGLEEAVPLALATWIPIVWTAFLVLRSRGNRRVSRG